MNIKDNSARTAEFDLFIYFHFGGSSSQKLRQGVFIIAAIQCVLFSHSCKQHKYANKKKTKNMGLGMYIGKFRIMNSQGLLLTSGKIVWNNISHDSVYLGFTITKFKCEKPYGKIRQGGPVSTACRITQSGLSLGLCIHFVVSLLLPDWLCFGKLIWCTLVLHVGSCRLSK